jgi:putative transposase
MLSDAQLDAYCARHGLSQGAADAIKQVRISDPARRGFSQHANLSGRFVSHKMGLTLGYSAKSTEALGLLDYELDEEVLEFWEEPGVELRFEYTDRTGKPRAGRFHPDTLVLAEDGAFIDEWKTEEQLLRDSERMPGRYLHDDSGWRSPSAEASAERRGLQFRLRTPATVRAEVNLNGAFLRDYYADPQPVAESTQTQVLERIAAAQGMTLDRLLRELPEVRSDDVFRLIVAGKLFVDLAHHRLADTFYVPLYTSRSLAPAGGPGSAAAVGGSDLTVAFEPGKELVWNGAAWTVVGVANEQVTLRATSGSMVPLQMHEARALVDAGSLRSARASGPSDRLADILRAASPTALRAAETKHKQLERFWSGKPVNAQRRSLERWQAAFRAAERTLGMGFAGLIAAARGRRPGPSLSDAVEQIIVTEIRNFYEKAEAPNKRALFGRVRNACVGAGLEAPSYPTLLRRIAQRDAQRADEKRRGRKAAYPTSAPIWLLASDTPIHGERPFELAHIDHTQLDVSLVDSETGKPLGRPWLTLMLDAYSRRVLAFWLTFDEPSYRSLLMALRRCVSRWSRLPDRFVVDGGAEFAGTYFELATAMFGVEVTTRPGKPRFGSVLERMFGATNTRLIHALAGNTKATKDVRSMSRDADPQVHAVWTLATLAPIFEEFFFEVYDQIPHPALGTSPRDFYERRLAQTGLRDLRHIADDEAFFFATLPTTTKGTARVDRQKGVKVNGLHYGAVELMAPGIPGTDVPIRYDPDDMRHAFAFVCGRWVECWCGSLRRFPAISERWVKTAISSEVRERSRQHGQSVPSTAATIARLLSAARLDEAVLRQARADAEARAMVGAPLALPAGPLAQFEPAQDSPIPEFVEYEVYDEYE